MVCLLWGVFFWSWMWTDTSLVLHWMMTRIRISGRTINIVSNMSNEKKAWLFRLYRGLYYHILPNYMGILISQYKDPYKPTSIMESRRVFFVAHMFLFLTLSLTSPPPCSWVLQQNSIDYYASVDNVTVDSAKSDNMISENSYAGSTFER